jgi:hypothetical protein
MPDLAWNQPIQTRFIRGCTVLKRGRVLKLEGRDGSVVIVKVEPYRPDHFGSGFGAARQGHVGMQRAVAQATERAAGHMSAVTSTPQVPMEMLGLIERQTLQAFLEWWVNEIVAWRNHCHVTGSAVENAGCPHALRIIDRSVDAIRQDYRELIDHLRDPTSLNYVENDDAHEGYAFFRQEFLSGQWYSMSDVATVRVIHTDSGYKERLVIVEDVQRQFKDRLSQNLKELGMILAVDLWNGNQDRLDVFKMPTFTNTPEAEAAELGVNVKNPGNVLLYSVDRAQPVPVGFDAYFPFSGAADEARPLRDVERATGCKWPGVVLASRHTIYAYAAAAIECLNRYLSTGKDIAADFDRNFLGPFDTTCRQLTDGIMVARSRIVHRYLEDYGTTGWPPPVQVADKMARVQGYDFQAAVGRALARYGGSGFGLRSKLTGSAESKATVAHLRALLEAHDIDAAYGTVDMAMAWRTPTSWSNPHLDAAWQAGVRPLKPDSRLCGILRAECGPYYTKSAIR